jgi:hypothetical protein
VQVKRLAFVVCLFGCGGAGSSDTQSCTQVECPTNNLTYQFCDNSSSCRYVTSDNQVFTCTNCSECAVAEGKVSTWCSAGGVVMGSTTSANTTTGNTTSGSTTGGQSCDLCVSNEELSDCQFAIADCNQDDGCLVLKDCLDGCTTQTCIDDCYTNDNPSVQSEDLYNSIVSCLCEFCASPCAAQCANSTTTG